MFFAFNRCCSSSPSQSRIPYFFHCDDAQFFRINFSFTAIYKKSWHYFSNQKYLFTCFSWRKWHDFNVFLVLCRKLSSIVGSGFFELFNADCNDNCVDDFPKRKSFIGVVIILRPGFHKFDEGYIFSFCSIIFWTISNLIVKTMTKTDKPKTIVAHMTFFMFIFSMPFALPYLAPLSFMTFIEFFILGIISNISYKLIAEAYSKNDLSIL